MDDLIRILGKIKYRQLTSICGKEGLKKSGKKIEVIKRLIENVPEAKLREYIMEKMGIGKKILEHEWVPEHRIMKDKEISELLEKHGIKKNQLPKILDSDPVTMLLGAKAGHVLEISRNRKTSGRTKYYRVVVHSLRD